MMTQSKDTVLTLDGVSGIGPEVVVRRTLRKGVTFVVQTSRRGKTGVTGIPTPEETSRSPERMARTNIRRKRLSN